jgi:hypothetical protein
MFLQTRTLKRPRLARAIGRVGAGELKASGKAQSFPSLPNDTEHQRVERGRSSLQTPNVRSFRLSRSENREDPLEAGCKQRSGSKTKRRNTR